MTFFLILKLYDFYTTEIHAFVIFTNPKIKQFWIGFGHRSRFHNYLHLEFFLICLKLSNAIFEKNSKKAP
jgi:hypothetical protein